MLASFWRARVLNVNLFQKLSLSTTKFNSVSLKACYYGCVNEKEVHKFTWCTKSGFTLSAMNYGATVTGIRVPDKENNLQDIILGFDDIKSWVHRNAHYFGATIGRFANRIRGGKFHLENKDYLLVQNDGENHLHGGCVGFDKKIWNVSVEGTRVTFSHLSEDGDEKYPGDLIVNLTFQVNEDPDALLLHYYVTTNSPTVINMTNHCYFNLAGHSAGPKGVYDTFVTINGDKITENDETLIPTGKILPVQNTPYDLRIARKLGDIIRDTELFDINYCVSTCVDPTKELRFIARASHPPSGRFIEIFSDQPGCHFYTGCKLPTTGQPPLEGKSCASYEKHGAFCLEPQLYPDSVNHMHFPNPILNPGEAYEHRVIYIFGTDKDDPCCPDDE